MFILRIAGDVLGQKRNIEVTFPQRPSLQQICTVAETILPLQGRRDRRPWRPPGLLDGSPLARFSPPSVDFPNPRHPASVGDYVVESIAFMNPATQQWEEVYSASQLTSGAQVYCFCPLQHHRVAVLQRKESPSPSARRSTTSPIPLSLLETLPVVTDVRDRWVNADRPGAIPEPQERLVWNCTTAATASDAAAVHLSPRRNSGEHSDEVLSSYVSAENARNRSRLGKAGTPVAASPYFTSNSPSAIRPSYVFREGSSEPRILGRIKRCSGIISSGLPDSIYHKLDGSGLSFTPDFPQTSINSHQTSFKGSYTPYGRNSPAVSYRRSGKRSIETSAVYGDRSSNNNISSASSVPLPSGSAGDRYTLLGERLAFLFDVLVHLDTQETGVGRHYLLLRDFYLLCSFLNASSLSSSTGTAVPMSPVNLTAALTAKFGLSWDDVLRSADRDRDGCIAYHEWIAYGIEHPDVIELLYQAVHRLPLHVNVARKRLCLQSASRSESAESLNLSLLFDHDVQADQMEARDSSATFTSTSYPCRIHNARSNERMRRIAKAAAVESKHTCSLSEGRCEACRELAAQTPEERLRWATRPTPFLNTLRQ